MGRKSPARPHRLAPGSGAGGVHVAAPGNVSLRPRLAVETLAAGAGNAAAVVIAAAVELVLQPAPFSPPLFLPTSTESFSDSKNAGVIPRKRR